MFTNLPGTYCFSLKVIKSDCTRICNLFLSKPIIDWATFNEISISNNKIINIVFFALMYKKIN